MKTKIQLENEMQDLLAQLEANLAQHYINRQVERNISLAKKKAKDYFKVVTKNDRTIFDLYNSVLNWCVNTDKTNIDGLNYLRTGFLKMHADCFKENILAAEKECSELLSSFVNRNEAVKAKFQSELEQANEIVTTYVEEFNHLKQEARKLTSEPIGEICTHDQFQIKIKRLQKTIDTLSLPDIRFPAKNFAVHALPTKTDFVPYRQQITLKDLDSAIESYMALLDQEGKGTRFIKWFSPARGRRLAAINDYKNSVASIPDAEVTRKYAAAESWFKKHGFHKEFNKKTTSRFYNTCLVHFHNAIGKDHFCQLTVINQQTLSQIKMHEDILINSTNNQNAKLRELNSTIKKTESDYQKLHGQVKTFVTAIDSIEETAWGYIQGNEKTLAAAQRAITQTVKAVSLSIQTALTIKSELLTLDRHPSNKTIEQMDLSTRVKTIADDKKALTVVQETVQQLINETHSHGGKGNNFLFSGTRTVDRVVSAIGTPDQKEVFSQEMRNAIKNKEVLQRKNINDVADQLVRKLSQELESGHLETKLTKWVEVYHRHKCTDMRVRTKESEKLYHNRILPDKSLAKKIHLSGNTALYGFVQKIMTDAVIASQECRHPKQKKYQKLSLDNIAMLMLVYGSAKQKEIWKTVTLPRISPTKPVMQAPSFLDSSASMSFRA